MKVGNSKCITLILDMPFSEPRFDNQCETVRKTRSSFSFPDSSHFHVADGFPTPFSDL